MAMVAEVTVMDEAGRVWLREHGGNCCEESLPLDLAMGTQAGGYTVEIGVVVAGMADELKGSRWRERGEDLGEGIGG
jgi:hypothetical protein